VTAEPGDSLDALLAGRSLDEFMDAFAAGEVSVPLDGLAELTDAWHEQEAARLTAGGIFPVCVVHGDPECADDERRQLELHRLAGQAGWYDTTVGGNDWTCWHFSGPDAETAAARFVGLADSIADRWWNTTRTHYPVFDQEPPE
jgi:hypothetical protein